MLSDKYNEAMDKIVASDELKEKIKKALFRGPGGKEKISC